MRSVLILVVALWGCGDDISGLPTDAGTDAGGRDGSSPEVCVTPNRICGSQCVNPLTDSRNCGECGNGCDSSSFCDMGSCASSCASDRAECGNSCVDFANDPMHCGGCDRGCMETEVCIGGSCRCPDGTIACGEQCTDTSTSASHCGGCGNACASDEICRTGDCVKVREADCDNGIDEDADGDRDCADSDCTGFEKECDCEVAGMTGIELCGDDGVFGECTGCPPPECGASMPCEDYGYECGTSATCEFDDTTTFDLLITRLALPASQPDGMGGVSDWDGFLGGGADVYVWVEVGEQTINYESFADWYNARTRVPMSEQPVRTMGTLDPDENNIIELTDDAALLIRGRPARDYMDYLRIWVWDDDGLTGDGEGPSNSELMNFCTFDLGPQHFGTGSRQWVCPERDILGEVTFTMSLREPR